MGSDGFRRIKISDDSERTYNIDGMVGNQARHLYDRVDIENNVA